MKATLAPSAPAPAGPPTVESAGSAESVMDVASRYIADEPAEPEQVGGFDDVDLSGAPALRPVKTLRARQRVTLYKAMMALQKRLEGREATAEGQVDINVDDLDVIVDMDEFLEKMAIDPEAYAAWATEEGGGPEPDSRIAALFSRYAEQLGEPAPSTT